ncbi:uncharacterized protein NECHADRAFT_81775 [Fusarium vanettenii 77-13-4]|uniref:Uncharacterized protein n=1 Tax=Fusarium vanettenii (strain ATCC MYA-4622 / CBS 123669 / FGSC 9596 / NRRL 45880 / 77-13-4) TaxID=660122 RepID=C7Z9J5_FUSV7|nr:uncharacterized protein NECHADRAFT_81775 [Fusarium vanettenii 77-13-4]EEU39109.1 hypothetical protein NECHADRAFT_81775 [Fusarium vanettenii 77-13-4]
MAFHQRHTHERSEAFRPSCTHTTMTRVYEKDSVCCSCRQSGQFGWLYRCTQDIEQIIDIGPPELDPSNPDSINAIGTRKGDKLSSGDMTVEEMAKYTPEHVGIISRQRKEVRNMIARENLKRSSNALFNTTRPPPGFESYTNDSIYAGQWSCGETQICQYRPPESPPDDDAYLNEYLLLMLDNKVASFREERPQRPQRRTKDDLYTLKPSRHFQAVKSDSGRMKTLSNVHQRQPSKSTLASSQNYLELLPSMEDMPTPSRRSDLTESPARPAIELNRREFRRASRLGQMRGEPRDASESSSLFHTNDSWDTDDLLTGFDDDAREFTPAPLRVDRGVSVTEESVETGVPDVDVITQV